MSKYSGLFQSQYAGEEVRINASFTNTGFLGFAGPERFFNGPFPRPNTMYGVAIADHTFGTDGAAAGNEFDFASVAIHEVTHGPATVIVVTRRRRKHAA